ncbi:protein trapped in endoderm-1 [Procambarus clarkii]|uniref:protein trapped in endoderm-1 n=1 Tax=Procambarus clarkii TaxID=6728 RepID=UPI001E670734|nr:protein trapped in endoderm-1-like [Procambarus clarkii]XP_045592256.1 protein trapped in endoderm-1-like [Procambarus clarkii]
MEATMDSLVFETDATVHSEAPGGQEASNSSMGDAAPVIHYPRAATIFAAAASILFILVGILGNLVTIIALSRSVKLRVHATTAFVISLCASDLLFCSINLPLTASRYIHESWVLGDTLCSIFPFFFYGNVAASLLNMVAITLNRYILIAHHGLYDRVYRHHYIYLMIAVVWLFSFGMMMPPLLGVWGRLGLDPPSFSCTILKKDGSSPKKFLFLFGFLLPMIAIVVCYSAIYYKVRESRRNLVAHTNKGGSPSTFNVHIARKEDLRLTKMMLTIFLCFLVSFLPLMIVNVADDDVLVPSLHVLASVLAWASAVVNPFVYAVTNRQYRSAYRKLFCCLRSKPGRASNSHSKSNSSRTFVTEFQYHASTGQVTSPVLANSTPDA